MILFAGATRKSRPATLELHGSGIVTGDNEGSRGD